MQLRRIIQDGDGIFGRRLDGGPPYPGTTDDLLTFQAEVSGHRDRGSMNTTALHRAFVISRQREHRVALAAPSQGYVTKETMIRRMLMKRGVTLNQHCIYPSDGTGDSPGQWFVADWREIGNASQEFGKQRVSNYRSFLDVTRAAQIKLAYIGVSISELCNIASTGELPSEGGIIYCDGAHRMRSMSFL